MTKVEISPNSAPFPKPIALVGSLVKGRPNFLTVAWLTRVNINPNIWGVALNKKRYTLEGVLENNTFSVNFPNAKLVQKTDYCGLYSGRDIDKSQIFDVFFGKLETAPMIRECPISAECSVYQTVDLPNDVFVLGEVKAIYTEEQYLTNGVLDQKKVNPFVFTRPADQYWALGLEVGKAYSIGKTLVKES
ncbi:MAG: flavin reductase family protein [Candidatus Thorarchaeota archaeon]